MFSSIKEVCISIIKTTSEDKIEELQRKINVHLPYNSEINAELFSYIFLPLKLSFIKNKNGLNIINDNLLIKILTFLKKLFSNYKISIVSINEVLNFFNGYFFTQSQEFIECSENLKFVYVILLKTIFKYNFIIQNLQDFTLILILTNLLKQTKSFSVRIKLLQCFRLLCGESFCPLDQTDSILICHFAGNILPGLTTIIFKIFIEEWRNRSKLIESILKTLSVLVFSVMNNFVFTEYIKHENVAVEESVERLAFVILEIACRCKTSNCDNIHKNFILFISGILLNCYEPFSKYIYRFLNVLISYGEISKETVEHRKMS
ncbi:hypothetical protein HZS_2399 [Henneguya salminicola]|nr:hypothetical protein HZS_2399 [Henneguya salminicola]